MKERQEERLSPLPKIGEGFGEWFEALLRTKEGWVVVKKIINVLKSRFFMIKVNWNRVAKWLRFAATVITTVLGTIAVQSCGR